MTLATATPTPTPPTREQLLYWLHEAAEIEHNLMCCYLYAAFSLKRTDPGWTDVQRDAVARWRRAIVAVALEEMGHLALVGNLVTALGSTPPLSRPAFPVDSGPYPDGFVIRLAPFCADTIEHFQYLERPGGEPVADGTGFEPRARYRRQVPDGRLSPGPRDYDTVGGLYAVLESALEAAVAADGEAAVFIGDPSLQLDATLAPLPGVAPVVDLASARAAIRTIVTQGEGAGHEQADSHFLRFAAIGRELAALSADDPAFEPAWPAATNPVMNRPVKAHAERVHLDHPVQSHWLDIGNAIYTTSLRCLLQGFAAPAGAPKRAWLEASFALMRALVPVGEGLAARPARAEAPRPHGGLTFTPLRTLALLPADVAAAVLAERLEQLVARAAALPVAPVAGEDPHSRERMTALLARQAAALRALVGVRPDAGTAALAAASLHEPAPPPAPVAPPPAVDAPAPAADPVEVAPGRDVTVLFEGRRCIHSRHCVLDAPTVFLANTPGAWIHPDTVAAETVVAVAHACPSGAIRYRRHDGKPDEAAPPVNQLRIRENGPYAVHAPLTVAGVPDGFRATLCRCGQSQRKPWCDGSHVAAGFQASGEPPTGDVEPLPVRDGPLAVEPLRDGPLAVRGPLEICAGTGRTVARVTEARLCRCGRSGHKPFCDGSHIAAGFRADGA